MGLEASLYLRAQFDSENSISLLLFIRYLSRIGYYLRAKIHHYRIFLVESRTFLLNVLRETPISLCQGG